MLCISLARSGRKSETSPKSKSSNDLRSGCGGDQGGFSLDSHAFGGIVDGCLKIGNLVDQFHRHGLPAGPDPAVGDALDLVILHFAAIRHVVDELLMHVVDEACM